MYHWKIKQHQASPLHVAVAMGHLEFVVELLRREPKLDEMIDNLKGSSPLHIASAKGHSQIIETLIGAKPHMCFARDQEGRTPIFVAAVCGQIDALELLHRANPYAAQGRTNDGETILHLCVIHNQLKALERLLELVDDDGNQLINSRDNDGNTVLHLAVIGKHSEMVEFFSGYPGLNKSAMNKNKMTALDIIGKKQNWKNSENRNVEQYLKRAKARPAKEVLKHQADGTWLEEQRTSLMVVASLIATMAFQVGINPPGGVWQETKVVNDKYANIVQEDGSNDSTHYAGTAILSYTNTAYWIWRHFLLILRIALWMAVIATTYTYYSAITILTYAGADNGGMYISTWFSLVACVGLIGIMLFGHVVRFILKLIGWERRQSLKRFCKMCFPKLTSAADNSSSSNNV
uniref:PGG domain-containing protein n=1 Tax=Chenopodium quinoa TaxID=63459 RepID=A0A803NCL9_CHEQI